MTRLSQFKRSTAISCLNDIILFNILRILYTNIFFKQNIFPPLLEKGDKSFEQLDGSDTRIKSG